MIIRNLVNWSEKLRLWEVEWGLTCNQAGTNAPKKFEDFQKKLIFTNRFASCDVKHSATNKESWGYYNRFFEEIPLRFEWHKFLLFWQKVKYKGRKTMLLYTDVFSDYPLVRHLGKQTNEAFSVGWYPGLNSNYQGLLKYKFSQLLHRTSIIEAPAIIITFSTFYSITEHFLKEKSKTNAYFISFVSFGDFYLPGAYLIHMTKNHVNLYYYFFLVYKILKTAPEQQLAFTQIRGNKILRNNRCAGKAARGWYRSRLRHIMWREQLMRLWCTKAETRRFVKPCFTKSKLQQYRKYYRWLKTKVYWNLKNSRNLRRRRQSRASTRLLQQQKPRVKKTNGKKTKRVFRKRKRASTVTYSTFRKKKWSAMGKGTKTK